MVDAADLKSADRKVVGVRVPSWAPWGFFILGRMDKRGN